MGDFMKTPDGMREKEVIATIQKVVDKIAPRYVTRAYSVEDMKQEAFIMCMEAIPRYDGKRPLENFLSVHVSNRMKNFLRDNVKVKDEAKYRVANPDQLSQDIEMASREDTYDSMDYKHMAEIVDSNIPASMRMDYLKMVNEFYVPKQRREEIVNFIKDSLKQHGYEKGKNF